jgi:hypothetical protein
MDLEKLVDSYGNTRLANIFGRDLNARIAYGAGFRGIMRKKRELPFVMNGFRESSRFGCTWEVLKIESPPLSLGLRPCRYPVPASHHSLTP